MRRQRRSVKRRRTVSIGHEAAAAAMLRSAIRVKKRQQTAAEDPDGALFARAAERGYPHAATAAQLHGARRTIDFLFKQAQYFPAVKPAPPNELCAVLNTSARIGERERHPQCVILSTATLLGRVLRAKQVRPPHAPPLPPFFASRAAYASHIASKGISSDIYVCMRHRRLFHVCGPRCPLAKQDFDSVLVCPVSGYRAPV